MPGLHCCTWARSGSDARLEILRESARLHGVQIDVMPCTGLMEKPAALKEYLLTRPPTDIVLCTDGYDVLYTGNAAAILDRFRALDAPIVMGGEMQCYHHLPDVKAHFDATECDGPFRYLNSGLLIGFAGPLLDMLQHIEASHLAVREKFHHAKNKVGFFNDQTLYGDFAKNHPDKISIDSRGELFWTLAEEKYDLCQYAQFSVDGVKIRQTGTMPCLVHVSHLQKFYLVYLAVAWRVGIDLGKLNLNRRLLSQSLEKLRNSHQTSEIKIDQESLSIITSLSAKHPKPAEQSNVVAIIFIGTGKYIGYLKKFYESVNELFLPATEKHFFAFTDQVHFEGFAHCRNLTFVKIKAEKWPYPTLLRYRYLTQIGAELSAFSHIVYIDADMYAYRSIAESEFYCHEKPLFGVQHPGNYLSGMASFEKNKSSMAYVDEAEQGSVYWQGCFWGGETMEVLRMCAELSSRIDDDLSRGIIAKWHDESHLNRYFVDMEDSVHTFDCGFAWPERMEPGPDLERKFVHVEKNNRDMRYSRESAPGRPSSAVTSPEVVPDPGLDTPLGGADIMAAVPGITLADEEQGCVLRDRHKQLIARLNDTSAQIWRLCNGHLNLEDILDVLGARYAVATEVIQDDVYSTLQGFIDLGVITRKPMTTPAPTPLDESGVRFYSFANDINRKQLAILKQSAFAQGVQLSILGDGLNRFSTTIKLDLLLERLSHLNDRAIVCMMDGFDVFFCGPGEEIKRRFLALDCDLVISAERSYAHQYKKHKAYFDEQATSSPYRYVNSGSIIGYAGAFKKMCKTTLLMKLQQKIFTASRIQQIKKTSQRLARSIGYDQFDSNLIYSYIYYTDQQHVGRYVATNPDNMKIHLDRDTRLFWCCAHEWRNIDEHYSVKRGRIVNRHTGNAPSLIHVPGWRAHGRVYRQLFEVQQSLKV